jgi:hypothetical protein
MTDSNVHCIQAARSLPMSPVGVGVGVGGAPCCRGTFFGWPPSFFISASVCWPPVHFSLASPHPPGAQYRGASVPVSECLFNLSLSVNLRCVMRLTKFSFFIYWIKLSLAWAWWWLPFTCSKPGFSLLLPSHLDLWLLCVNDTAVSLPAGSFDLAVSLFIVTGRAWLHWHNCPCD